MTLHYSSTDGTDVVGAIDPNRPGAVQVYPPLPLHRPRRRRRRGSDRIYRMKQNLSDKNSVNFIQTIRVIRGIRGSTDAPASDTDAATTFVSIRG